MADRLFVTCEHAGNVVPTEYAPLFVGHEHLLTTHRGWDPGALTLAREMAERFDAPLYYDETTRLLADLNRSVGTPDLHSEATRHLPKAERRRLLEAYYFPHRRRVDVALDDAVDRGDRRRRPRSSTSPRTASRPNCTATSAPPTSACCTTRAGPARWRSRPPGSTALRVSGRDAPLRRNYPYLGASDGVCQVMRRRYPPAAYVGVELEVNQRYVEAGGPAWPAIRRTLVETLGQALEPARR